jgi:hypothetical protein
MQNRRNANEWSIRCAAYAPRRSHYQCVRRSMRKGIGWGFNAKGSTRTVASYVLDLIFGYRFQWLRLHADCILYIGIGLVMVGIHCLLSFLVDIFNLTVDFHPLHLSHVLAFLPSSEGHHLVTPSHYRHLRFIYWHVTNSRKRQGLDKNKGRRLRFYFEDKARIGFDSFLGNSNG